MDMPAEEILSQWPEEGAYFCGQEGIFYLGEGPFEELPEPPGTGTAFYVNDYELTDPLPWKVPSRLFKNVQPAMVCPEVLPSAGSWRQPSSEDFAHVFHEIQENIQNGNLQKTVPFVSEWLPCLNTEIHEYLLSAATRHRAPQFPYAWWNRKEGMAGATPEWLFKVNGTLLETMALAGTARKEDAALFNLDRKEIREHEYVAHTIMEKLSLFGSVTREPREIVDLKNLIHFLSIIRVELSAPVTSLNGLIARLHPTPALGPLPRTAENFALTCGWRHYLHCRKKYGAPFGLLHEGRFQCAVAIRGIHWDRERLYLPSGCGMIAESKLTQEWNELLLKRNAVRKIFGL